MSGLQAFTIFVCTLQSNAPVQRRHFPETRSVKQLYTAAWASLMFSNSHAVLEQVLATSNPGSLVCVIRPIHKAAWLSERSTWDETIGSLLADDFSPVSTFCTSLVFTSSLLWCNRKRCFSSLVWATSFCSVLRANAGYVENRIFYCLLSLVVLTWTQFLSSEIVSKDKILGRLCARFTSQGRLFCRNR